MLFFCFPKFSINYTNAELSKKLVELNNITGNLFSDNKYKKIKHDKVVALITEILYRSSHEQLHFQNSNGLIVCTIKILITYANAPFLYNNIVARKTYKRKYKHAKNNYTRLLKIFKSDKQGEIINIVIDVLHKGKLWEYKTICVEIINSLFDYGYNGTLIYHEICDKMELCQKTKDLYNISFIVKVLYECLGTYSWAETEATVIFLKRFLNLYSYSLYDNSEDSQISFYINLRSSLDLCVRQIIKNVSNYHLLIIIQYMSTWLIREDENDNFILNCSGTVEYAAYVHKDDFLCNILIPDILFLLMKMIRSKNKIISLLGNRIFQYLIDRGNNLTLFNTPTIFFEDVKLKVNINKYYKDDREFIKHHRELIHHSVIKSFINHRFTRLNLETTYCTCCLIAAEVPCGFTAASLSCLMMNLQEMIRRHSKKYGSKEENFHIHAIIISILSFVCWIHKAKAFHNYVNKVLMERAQWAPHLNPPLKPYYNFALHHVLWDKPELFFVNWEVRYGLWRCFRLDQNLRTQSFLYEL